MHLYQDHVQTVIIKSTHIPARNNRMERVGGDHRDVSDVAECMESMSLSSKHNSLIGIVRSLVHILYCLTRTRICRHHIVQIDPSSFSSVSDKIYPHQAQMAPAGVVSVTVKSVDGQFSES